MPGVDLLTDVLAQPRAREAFLLRVLMRPPWRVDVADEAPLSVVPVLRGAVVLLVDGAPAARLTPGDVLVVREPTAYALASAVDVPATVRIGAGQACTGPEGRDLSTALLSGVRTWGNDPKGEDELLVGTYRSGSQLGRMLLGSLPPWLVVHGQAPELVRLLAEETAQERVAQGSVLDRLLDVLTVATLRAWADGEGAGRSGLLAVDRDEVVRAAVAALQRDLAAPWGTESLARIAGVSRACLTRRFVSALGVPPMSFVTQWRLAMASELLERSDLTVAAVAHRVGYATPFSFSAAFKRQHGVSPQAYRQRVGGGGPAAAATSRGRG